MPLQPEIGTGVIVRPAIIDGSADFYVGRRKGSHAAGQLALPGGAMDAEDKTPEAAAKREIEEEMGVEAVGWKPLGFWTWDTFDDTDRRFLVVYFECTTNQTPFLMEPHKCEGWELRHWQGDLEHVPPTELFSGLWHLGIRGFLG